MSTIALEKARSAWLLTFGDVVTLLITFFILAIALNKGEITYIQKWTEGEIDKSYELLVEEEDDFEFFTINRNSLGIEILIEDSTAFQKDSLEPSLRLKLELLALARTMNQLPLFNMSRDEMPDYILTQVVKNDLQWRVDVSISGHTDNEKIDPRTKLRNNWFLSTIRAQKVMEILEQQTEFDESVFSVSGYGEYRPVVENDTPNNMASNRRIDIVISATLEKKPEVVPELELPEILFSSDLEG